MKIADLHNFVIVAQAKSVSGAAETLCRTPPAISASIKRLERDVGMALFERGSARPSKLTSEGQVLYDYAVRLLALRDDAVKAIEQLPDDSADRSPK